MTAANINTLLQLDGSKPLGVGFHVYRMPDMRYD
jgi:hypothetical protein